MKYTAKDVEDAATICAIKAAGWGDGALIDGTEAGDAIGASHEAQVLMCRASDEAYDSDRGALWCVTFAEAEAMLRTGWLPPGATRSKARGRR